MKLRDLMQPYDGHCNSYSTYLLLNVSPQQVLNMLNRLDIDGAGNGYILDDRHFCFEIEKAKSTSSTYLPRNSILSVMLILLGMKFILWSQKTVKTMMDLPLDGQMEPHTTEKVRATAIKDFGMHLLLMLTMKTVRSFILALELLRRT